MPVPPSGWWCTTRALLPFVGATLCFGAADAQPDAAPRPNVLFIVVDDLKPALGAYGDPLARTPHIDALAARGTVFTNAHCQQAVCAPSRVSVLTGLRPDTTRVWDLKTRFREQLPNVVTLPQRFKGAGYQSVGVGKVYDVRSTDSASQMDEASWSVPYLHVEAPADDTFTFRDPDTVELIQRRRAQIDDMPAGWVEQIKLIFGSQGQPVTDRASVPDEAYVDGAVAKVAAEQVGWLAASDEPYFFAVGFKKPHLPFNAPEPYWAMHDPAAFPIAGEQPPPLDAPEYAPQHGWELRAVYDVPRTGPLPDDLQREMMHGYYAATSYIDAQVGKLLEAVRASGEADHTIIVLWGDHGWHFGDHGMWCKHTNYEQATRSPLIIAAPGVGAPGSRVDAPVELVDLYPTLVDLAGLDEASAGPHALEGVSLRPAMVDPSLSIKPFAISQFPREVDGGLLQGYAYRTQRYRLIQWRGFDKQNPSAPGAVVATELYDYELEHAEARNLADDPAYATVMTQLLGLIGQSSR